jgi:hypothetical protein
MAVNIISRLRPGSKICEALFKLDPKAIDYFSTRTPDQPAFRSAFAASRPDRVGCPNLDRVGPKFCNSAVNEIGAAIRDKDR